MNSTPFFPNVLADSIETLGSLHGRSDRTAQTSQPISGGAAQSERNTGLIEAADEALFEQLVEGDRDALAILFRRYARLVRAVAYRILRNAGEADDLVQEVFLFIFRKSALFDRERGSARSWIVQATYHRAVDRRRYLASRHFYRSVELEDGILCAEDLRLEVTFYERSIEGILGKELLRKVDDALSEDQRQTIRLYFFEGYTLEEIAGLTGQTLKNVTNHYYRGLEKMRQQIFGRKSGPYGRKWLQRRSRAIAAKRIP